MAESKMLKRTIFGHIASKNSVKLEDEEMDVFIYRIEIARRGRKKMIKENDIHLRIYKKGDLTVPLISKALQT